MKSTTSTKKETTKKPPLCLTGLLGGWGLGSDSRICIPTPSPIFCLIPAQPPSEERKSKPAQWHTAARRCKFYPWILLVQKYCSLNKGADVTAGIAIKEKNTKLISTSRVLSFLCPQNGIRKSRASINEIMTYVSGSSFLYSSGFNFPKKQS